MEWRLLAGVSPQDVEVLLAATERRTFRRGQVVFHEDDEADALHLVEAGRFGVRAGPMLVSVAAPGDAFGELALVGGGRRGATVQALSDGATLALARPAFAALRRQRPAVDAALAAILAWRIRRLTDQLVEARVADADVRVRRRLVDLARAFGGAIPLTQEEIANAAGTSRATVNRVLREEEAKGTVTLGRGRTTVLDAAALSVH
ncbi:MAG TPA: Crp/Fnr family transcriptional regulator [Gaiellaceae bacterium]